MSVSVTMYRSEKFETGDIVSRDHSDSEPGDKYLMDYSDKRISETRKRMQNGVESSGRDAKMDSDFSDNETNSYEHVPNHRRLGIEQNGDHELSNVSASVESTKNKENVLQTHTRNKTKQENSDNSEDAVNVRKTSFSVSDILDPQKFIGSNGGRTPVWHPWLREDVVQDYSKSNLEREEKQRGLYALIPYFSIK